MMVNLLTLRIKKQIEVSLLYVNVIGFLLICILIDPQFGSLTQEVRKGMTHPSWGVAKSNSHQLGGKRVIVCRRILINVNEGGMLGSFFSTRIQLEGRDLAPLIALDFFCYFLVHIINT